MRVLMIDVDGVLVRGRPADGRAHFSDLEADLGLSLHRLQSTFFAPHWADIVTGRVAMKPVLEKVLREIAPHLAAQTVIDYWFHNDSRIDRGLLDAIDGERRAGRRVFLATNQEHLRAAYLMAELGLAGHVDGILYSAALGHRKPSRAFYSLATERVGAGAADIVLVDDTLDNIVAARDFGWNGVHWAEGMDLAMALRSPAAS